MPGLSPRIKGPKVRSTEQIVNERLLGSGWLGQSTMTTRGPRGRVGVSDINMFFSLKVCGSGRMLEVVSTVP